MRPNLLTLTALIACATLTSSCALFAPVSAPVQPIAAPQRQMPQTAKEACQLVGRLPANPTLSDLEIGYALRGAEILSCDARRELAVEIHERQNAEQQQWRDQLTPRSWWQKILRTR